MAHIIYVYKGRVVNLSALADKLAKEGVPGASISNLSRVFSGRHRPRFDLALALARIGGMTIEEVDEMLRSCKQQHEQWKYTPSFGFMPTPRQRQTATAKRKAAVVAKERDKKE